MDSISRRLMRHRLEGDAVAGGFALGLALLASSMRWMRSWRQSSRMSRKRSASVTSSFSHRHQYCCHRPYRTCHRPPCDAQLEQSEQLTQRFRYGLIALIGGLGQALDAATKRVGVLGIDLEPAISDWRMVS